MYPLGSQTPSLTPPTPPNNFSPTEPDFTSSFSRSSPPPHLQSLPARRQRSDPNSQIIVTPNEMAAQQQMARNFAVAPPLEEPLLIDPVLASAGIQRESLHSDGYFEGVVGLKQDGTALIDKNIATSPYARYPNSPATNLHHHPYRRPATLTSPNKGIGQKHSSPTYQYNPVQRSFSPSSLGTSMTEKPAFAISFTPQTGGYSFQRQEGMLAPPLDQAIKMEKQASADEDPTKWQRW